ncbi:rhodanese-like domain-containing protein [Desulfovibrio sp. JC010]|uniref:rhodanese-like domain-containing protein n=1 Tax=Desulfovibrio sp. JC010 TaxID=2593641 RepID=UPI0013D06F7D|nr:rhodanese-like domain-containing protein [Desulfovibrio sp. JC010]NDV28024.1 rhodanese-like domain-containing protein [Desulfovibrio sp. JC010]
MKALNDAVAEMDFDFLSSGEHTMSIEGMRKVLGSENSEVVFLDVRSDKEMKYLVLPFAKHIPLNELPARLDELPKDKLIVAYCTSIFRSAVAYTLLRAHGFDQVKGMAASMEDMVGAFKPGPLGKM